MFQPSLLASRIPTSWVLTCVCVLASACGIMPGKSAQTPIRDYSLNGGLAPGPSESAGMNSESCVSAQVMMPRAAAGFNTSRMAYTQGQDSLNYFAYSQWVDTPSYMLQPLLVEALRQSGRFRSVVMSPSPIRTRYRLLSDNLAVVQQVDGDRNVVRIALRLQLLDLREGVLVIDEPIVLEQTTSANAAAGVTAANQLARQLLERVAEKTAAAISVQAVCTDPAKPGTS